LFSCACAGIIIIFISPANGFNFVGVNKAIFGVDIITVIAEISRHKKLSRQEDFFPLISLALDFLK